MFVTSEGTRWDYEEGDALNGNNRDRLTHGNRCLLIRLVELGKPVSSIVFNPSGMPKYNGAIGDASGWFWKQLKGRSRKWRTQNSTYLVFEELVGVSICLLRQYLIELS